MSSRDEYSDDGDFTDLLMNEEAEAQSVQPGSAALAPTPATTAANTTPSATAHASDYPGWLWDYATQAWVADTLHPHPPDAASQSQSQSHQTDGAIAMPVEREPEQARTSDSAQRSEASASSAIDEAAETQPTTTQQANSSICTQRDPSYPAPPPAAAPARTVKSPRRSAYGSPASASAPPVAAATPMPMPMPVPMPVPPSTVAPSPAQSTPRLRRSRALPRGQARVMAASPSTARSVLPPPRVRGHGLSLQSEAQALSSAPLSAPRQGSSQLPSSTPSTYAPCSRKFPSLAPTPPLPPRAFIIHRPAAAVAAAAAAVADAEAEPKESTPYQPTRAVSASTQHVTHAAPVTMDSSVSRSSLTHRPRLSAAVSSPDSPSNPYNRLVALTLSPSYSFRKIDRAGAGGASVTLPRLFIPSPPPPSRPPAAAAAAVAPPASGTPRRGRQYRTAHAATPSARTMGGAGTNEPRVANSAAGAAAASESIAAAASSSPAAPALPYHVSRTRNPPVHAPKVYTWSDDLPGLSFAPPEDRLRGGGDSPPTAAASELASIDTAKQTELQRRRIGTAATVDRRREVARPKAAREAELQAQAVAEAQALVRAKRERRTSSVRFSRRENATRQRQEREKLEQLVALIDAESMRAREAREKLLREQEEIRLSLAARGRGDTRKMKDKGATSVLRLTGGSGGRSGDSSTPSAADLRASPPRESPPPLHPVGASPPTQSLGANVSPPPPPLPPSPPPPSFSLILSPPPPDSTPVPASGTGVGAGTSAGPGASAVPVVSNSSQVPIQGVVDGEEGGEREEERAEAEGAQRAQETKEVQATMHEEGGSHHLASSPYIRADLSALHDAHVLDDYGGVRNSDELAMDATFLLSDESTIAAAPVPAPTTDMAIEGMEAKEQLVRGEGYGYGVGLARVGEFPSHGFDTADPSAVPPPPAAAATGTGTESPTTARVLQAWSVTLAVAQEMLSVAQSEVEAQEQAELASSALAALVPAPTSASTSAPASTATAPVSPGEFVPSLLVLSEGKKVFAIASAHPHPDPSSLLHAVGDKIPLEELTADDRVTGVPVITQEDGRIFAATSPFFVSAAASSPLPPPPADSATAPTRATPSIPEEALSNGVIVGGGGGSIGDGDSSHTRTEGPNANSLPADGSVQDGSNVVVAPPTSAPTADPGPSTLSAGQSALGHGRPPAVARGPTWGRKPSISPAARGKGNRGDSMAAAAAAAVAAEAKAHTSTMQRSRKSPVEHSEGGDLPRSADVPPTIAPSALPAPAVASPTSTPAPAPALASVIPTASSSVADKSTAASPSGGASEPPSSSSSSSSDDEKDDEEDDDYANEYYDVSNSAAVDPSPHSSVQPDTPPAPDAADAAAPGLTTPAVPPKRASSSSAAANFGSMISVAGIRNGSRLQSGVDGESTEPAKLAAAAAATPHPPKRGSSGTASAAPKSMSGKRHSGGSGVVAAATGTGAAAAAAAP